MFAQSLKRILIDSISSVTSNIEKYVSHPGKDFSRVKKVSSDQTISFLISQGGSSSQCECMDYFQLNPDAPSVSAINQRRNQLKPSAFEEVFHTFTQNIQEIDSTASESESSESPISYRYIAADGSSISFFSFPKYTSEDYFVKEGHSARGFYSLHINALYDLHKRIYLDGFLQPVHRKDEFLAFCKMVDRQIIPDSEKYVYIGDRGYCSYNNMAHVISKNQFFLFRTKDINQKGLVGKFKFPDDPEFDISVSVTLVRSQKKSIFIPEKHYRRFVDKATSFDFIEYGSEETYSLSFRIVRFCISENTYECIVTNLPENNFPMERIKELYNSRWGIESSFRKLKYTIGLSNYHAYKPEFIEQEIWAKMIAYNATEILINHTCIKRNDTKHDYKINFTVAAHICRIYLRLHTEIDSRDVMTLISKKLIPIRKDRQFPRLKTAHFRKPKYLIYRTA